jgi:hypothetical protein
MVLSQVFSLMLANRFELAQPMRDVFVGVIAEKVRHARILVFLPGHPKTTVAVPS